MSNQNSGYNNRILFVVAVWTLLFLLVIGSAFNLQVVQGQAYLKQASAINRFVDKITAPRGLIYDSKGVPLVSNEPRFSLYVLPGEIPSARADEILTAIATRFGADVNSLQETYRARGFTAAGQPVAERVTLLASLSYESYLAYTSLPETLPGVYIASEASRNYLASEAYAHLLGYLGDVNDQERAKFDLDPRARIGKDGLEKYYDQQLRGSDGKSVREQSLLGEGSRSWLATDTRAGANLRLSIDSQWQETLYDALAKYTDQEATALGSAGVIMEADTGKLKALVSYPGFDVNLFTKGISSSDFNKLLSDESTPLLNRATSMQIPTGSVFKVLMAGPLLQEQAVQRSTIYKSGCFELPGDYKICEADGKNYGAINLIDALARSSNPYFCQAVVEFARQERDDDAAARALAQYLTTFGLGKGTGVDLPSELAGTVPSPELKERLQKEPWYLADLCNSVIGQGLVTATPLQMATAMAAVVNGGNVWQPSLVEYLDPLDSSSQYLGEPQLAAKVDISEANLAIVREGMAAAVARGTATGLRDVPGNVLAKTGSAEAGRVKIHGKFQDVAHSWLLGSFNYAGKNYSFAIAIQYGGRGFKSVPVMADFLRCLFADFQACTL